jgi:hypothetical protein
VLFRLTATLTVEGGSRIALPSRRRRTSPGRRASVGALKFATVRESRIDGDAYIGSDNCTDSIDPQ